VVPVKCVGGWVGGVGGCLPCAPDLGTRQIVYRVFFLDTRQTICLPCAPDLGTWQTVYRVFFARHTANGLFAVCSKICTRQKFGHTANWPFP